jgi:NAD-dependent deacetylase
VEAVITQNIDGLHQASGIPEEKIIELHGSNRRVRCMTCGRISSIEEAHARIEAGDPAPECACGGYLKPDTISFGQAMPQREMEKAVALSRSADFFLVVGSTLLVNPAASIPYYAKDEGAFLAIVNLSDTPCDQICDVLIRRKAGDVLPKIVERLQSDAV